MASEQQKTSPDSDKPSFFGMPVMVRFWAQAGRRFWAGALFGLLNGLGVGIVTGVAMVLDWGFIKPEGDGRGAGIALVLLVVSTFWAQWFFGLNARQQAG